jgi:uncharacterized membrane protein
MFGWMVLALVALLAAPVLSIIALVLAIGDSALLRQLNERLKVLERGQAAKSAPAPGPTPQPTPQSAPAPIVAAPAETPPPPPTSVPVSSSPRAPSSAQKIGLEERFGTRWVVWVGGVALALGGIFLVRYTIQQGLIGPGVRIFSAPCWRLRWSQSANGRGAPRSFRRSPACRRRIFQAR